MFSRVMHLVVLVCVQYVGIYMYFVLKSGCFGPFCLKIAC